MCAAWWCWAGLHFGIFPKIRPRHDDVILTAGDCMDISCVTTEYRRIIIFDAECAFCSSWVRWVFHRDTRGLFLFCPLQSPKGKAFIDRLDPAVDPSRTMVTIEQGRMYTRSTAFLRVVRYLKFPWCMLYAGVVVPRPVRNWIYEKIALHRFRLFGRSDACASMPEKMKPRVLT